MPTLGPAQTNRAQLGWALLALWLSIGCASAAVRPSAPAPGPTSGAAATPPDSAESGTAASGSARPSSLQGGAPSAASTPLPGGEEPTPSRALPELRVESLGMHVGGGRNDAQEKAPFQRALERQFPAFLECYRLSEEPLQGGSFGIDLKVPRGGGHPTLEQPRTKLRGAALRDCLVAAFARTEFEKPRAGPTVISYSIRFTLGSR